jgi:hypothetical protein
MCSPGYWQNHFSFLTKSFFILSMNAAQAFIAYLRCEARQAEERAKSLRATAAAIQSNAELSEYEIE